MKITSTDLLSLLAIKHTNDLFIPECKTGPTQTGSYLRFDAWIMPRSWVRWDTIGYEIKVSRADFLNDNKWEGYLDYCHKFFFVCPPGIIDKKELPNNVGLLVSSQNGTKLYTKRRAVRRDIDIPQSILIYILMARLEEFKEEDKSNYWKNWLERKGNLQEVGHNVSRRLSKLIQTKIKEERRRNDSLQSQIKVLKDIETFCRNNQIIYSESFPEWKIRKIIEKAEGKDTIRYIDSIINTLIGLKNRIDDSKKNKST